MTSVHISPQKAPSGKPKGFDKRKRERLFNAAMLLLPYLSFGTAQRSVPSQSR
jgi:hypothetical protein